MGFEGVFCVLCVAAFFLFVCLSGARHCRWRAKGEKEKKKEVRAARSVQRVIVRQYIWLACCAVREQQRYGVMEYVRVAEPHENGGGTETNYSPAKLAKDATQTPENPSLILSLSLL